MWKEFKEFAFKGNVIDMAVGVIIGGAFGKIVTSLVNDVLMPLFGALTSGADFSTMKFVISEAVMEGDKLIKAEAAILYGQFVKNIIDFFIIAFSIFMFVKIMNKTRERFEKKKEQEEQIAEVKPTSEELLTEIRDLLKQTKE